MHAGRMLLVCFMTMATWFLISFFLGDWGIQTFGDIGWFAVACLGGLVLGITVGTLTRGWVFDD